MSLSNFLSLYKVSKGQEYTHTSLGKPVGSYYIPSWKTESLVTRYKDALMTGSDLFLTEKHRHIGPLFIDLDFRFNIETTYTPEVIDGIVSIYFNGIIHRLSCPPDSLECYVCEKSCHPILIKNGKYKSGLHLCFPHITTRPEIQLMIRNDILIKMDEFLKSILPQQTNSIDQVIDESVIDTNNWMMYGSHKIDSETYSFTRVYRYDLSNMSSNVLCSVPRHPCYYVDLFSIRNKDVITETKKEFNNELASFIEEREDRRKRREIEQNFTSTSNKINNLMYDDLEFVISLVKILNLSRFDNYTEWMRIGWCLSNIDNRLLDVWIECSKKSYKYIPGECERLWTLMRRGSLGIGSLVWWAKQDDPDAYNKVIQPRLRKLIMNTMAGTHHDVAIVVQYMYQYDYRCADIKHKVWYEFKNHRWIECDSAYTLRVKLSCDIYKEYQNVLQSIHGVIASTAMTPDSEEHKLAESRFNKLKSVANKLKDSRFKDNIIRECSELFKENGFESKLDSDPNLLGFNNGVYDLERLEFREGRPDDYVSFSTGIEYLTYQHDHPIQNELKTFLSQVHPDKAIRDYVLNTLASCLSGNIREERFHIWTGSGSNGKSLTVSLFEKTLGSYCCKFPVTLLTQKRTASSSATPEIARAKGRRFAVLQEPSEDERLNIGQMKELSGGDIVQTRELFKAPTEWKPQFKLFLLCNQLPNVPSDDGGTWRRIRVVQFGSKFCENPNQENSNEFPIDTELSQKIINWRTHFMALLIDVYKKYIKQPIHEPAQVTSYTREYQRMNDHLADFVDMCIVKKPLQPEIMLKLETVYSAYKEWAKVEQITLTSQVKKGKFQAYLDRTFGKCIKVHGKIAWSGLTIEDQDPLF